MAVTPKLRILLSVVLFFYATCICTNYTDSSGNSKIQRQWSSNPNKHFSSGCPTKCMCFGKAVRCMQLGLTRIPKISANKHTALLDLRFNKIAKIDTGSFHGYRNVRILLLNHNQLSDLKNGTFFGLVHIKYLYLYRNIINFIDPDVFHGLPKLEHLYLQFNQLEHIHPNTFSNIPSLVRLFLHHNRIKHIPAGAFSHLPLLQRLRLDQNALVCDCKIAWFSEMLNVNTIQVAAHCNQPHEMNGKSLVGMRVDDLHCRPPTILRQPQDIEISWGENAVFSCQIQTTDESTSIVWSRNKEQLPLRNHKNKYELLNNGSLVVKNTEPKDSGYYECNAINADGETKSRRAHMIVRRDINKKNNLHFASSPQPIVTTSESETQVLLFCPVQGYPPPTVTWSRNGIELTSTERFYILPNHSLRIGPIQTSDHGTYTCTASNIHKKISTEINLIVNVAPTFTIYPESIQVVVGGTIKLECVAVGSPTPTITWFKDDVEIDPTDQRVILSRDHTYLEIRSSIEFDSGLYICEAQNELGYREVSATVNVTSRALGKPPTFIQAPYDTETHLGSTIEIPCRATGNPTPAIQWQKDGQSLQRTGRTKVSVVGSLYIYSVQTDDQGRYECTALNTHGRATAAGYLTVKSHTDQKFIKLAYIRASNDIDAAINGTIRSIFKDRNHTLIDQLRLVRFPDVSERQIARAAEVYERTLTYLRESINDGLSANVSRPFRYEHITLTPDHLELVARLSGCMTHQHVPDCSTELCRHRRYRSINGTCNNFQHPMWGAARTGFRRLLSPIYEDGFSTPVGWNDDKKYAGYKKPAARLVSLRLITTKHTTPDPELTHMVMQWGQFLDHDLDHAIPSTSSRTWDGGVDCKKTCDFAAPCYPMLVPDDDTRVRNRRCIDFIRSAAICGSGMTSVFFGRVQPREQINQLTSFIDASQVYGHSEQLARELRQSSGRLLEGVQFPGRKPLLPYAAGQHGMDCRRNLSESTVNCFLAGDVRVNEQLGLIAMHTLWMREHNRIARQLSVMNAHWSDDQVYEESRKIVGAAMQHITYAHWLPRILGPSGMNLLGPYRGYNPTLNPSIANVFATAALRFGHTLINPILQRYDEHWQSIREGHVPLHKAFFASWRIVEEGGIDPLLRGLMATPAKLKTARQNLNADLTEHLFETAHAVALDLAAMNIQRSRDHALPGYLEFRKFCNLTHSDFFDDLINNISDRSVIEELKKLYGHPANIDVWVGAVLEDVIPGARVGPLFQCLLIEQFRRLRDGDRFYYEHGSVFSVDQLLQIKQYSLSLLLCENGDNITKVSKNTFELPERQGGWLSCTDIPNVDLRYWADCCESCSANITPNRHFSPNNLSTINKDVRTKRYVGNATATVNTTLDAQIIELNNKILQLKYELNRLNTRLEQTLEMINKVN